MDELISSLKTLREGLDAEYACLQEVFKVETDVEKMDALDIKMTQLGKDITALATKILAAEVAAKKSSFDPGLMRELAKRVAEHGAKTARAIKEHSDSVEQANFLASRVASGIKLVGDILKTI